MSKICVAVWALGAALALGACGQPPAPAPLPPLATPAKAEPVSPVLASNTPAFVRKLTMAHFIEAETSRIAARTTHSQDVRQFARTLASEAAGEMRAFAPLASDAGVTPPAAPDPSANAAIEEVRQADARAMDARYLDTFISSRQAAIDEMERYAQTGENGALRAWASQALPGLRARLQEADTLRQSVNVSPG